MKFQHGKANQNSRLVTLSASFGLAALLLGGASARATNYAGNNDGGFGGPIGHGTLTLTDDGTNIHGNLTVGANLNDVLVIFVDTGAGGGFADTSGFNDQNDGNRKAISGVQGTSRSVMTFMTGFSPQYGIALGPSATSFGGIWKLANGGNNSLPYVDSVGLAPTGNSAGPFTFSFPASDLGLIPGSKATIKIFGTLISDTGYRSSEAIAGNDSGIQGNNPFTQTAMATYTFDAGAPVLTPVTFRVDMTEQIANGNFTPANGDTVYATGTFQSIPWTGFPLTNGTGANSNIYSGMYLDPNTTNTVEQFKFYEVNATASTTNYEGTDNRLFTLQPGAQTEPLVYFTDLAPSPSATTNNITFQIDMTDAIVLGTFNPATETIEAFGSFEAPAQWSAGFILTNNPNGANTNLYKGTYPDGNYPGSFEQFKFVIVNSGVNTYESINNRDFNTPSGAATFPVAYFNNISNVVSVPVTFQVDMTAQVEAGNVNPGAGINVGLIASFQNPAYSEANLTNTTVNGNTNIYAGTFIITQQPGFVINYKFVIDNNGNLSYEQPTSTEGNNRVFALGSSAQTLPVVFWSDTDPNNVLPVATEVTFTVDMTNAVDVNDVPFNPSADTVYINGTLPPTDQFISALWTDPTVSSDYSAYQLSEVGFSSLYSVSFLIPAGSPLQLTYKYGIFHNAGFVNTGNLDNEAGFGENHTRDIRAEGTYALPVDIFGQQTTNVTDATEIDFGNLAVSSPSAGHIALTWLGRPGVYLQSTTNLSSQIWVTDTNSGGGISATNLSAAGGSKFFRLVNP